MISMARYVSLWLEAHPEATPEQRAQAVAQVPVWQLRYWPELLVHSTTAPAVGGARE